MEGRAVKALQFKRNPAQKCVLVLTVDGLVGHPGQHAQQTVCISVEEVALIQPRPMEVATAKERI